MLHVATGNNNVNYDKFGPTAKGNIMLKEAFRVLKHKKETRRSQNYVASFLLMPAKDGIRNHGDKAASALLKESSNQMTKKRSK